MSAYAPREGSVAQRVMWFLEEHGPSSTTTLCDDIEEVQRQSLVGCLATAVTHKAIYTQKREGENWYSLKPFAAGTVEQQLDPDLADLAPGMQKIIRDLDTVKPAAPAVASLAAKLKAPKVETLTEQLPTRKPRTFACGLFSDGRLVLELAGGTDVVLQRGETLELVRFLDRTLTTGELAS